jgi:hypothetical protein
MSGGAKALAGAVAWIGFVWLHVPNVHHGAWAGALVMFAALAIVPLLLEVVELAMGGRALAPACLDSERFLRWAMRAQLPAALVLGLAFHMEQGVTAATCALPWTAVLLSIAVAGALGLKRDGVGSAPGLCRNAGMIFAAIGAAWLMADRLGIRPLGFDAEIVLLTAVHFHFAGLILPVLAAEALERLPRRRVAAAIAAGVIAGVPAVAVGIALAQLGVGRGVEAGAALAMALAGGAVAIVHVYLGLRPDAPAGVRCLWMTAGCSLIAGMALAALYGLRGIWAPWPWLDVPWMRALHGTMNSLGFALPALLGWCRFRRACCS